MFPVQSILDRSLFAGADSPSTRIKTLVTELVRDARGHQTVPRGADTHIRSGIEWLYNSQDVTDVGGSASNYNLILGWGGPYPETTGYIIPTLYDYANSRESAAARDRAERMATWLLDTQLEDGGFPASDDPENVTEPSVFNTGQVLLGLTRAAAETGDQRYLNSARRASRWLVQVQHEDGYWDRFDYRDAVHTYTSRVAWPLIVVSEHTGVTAFREAAVDNLSWVVDQQHENGWFEHCGFDRGQDPFLHTIAYTIRGLLEGGRRLENDRFVESARAAADTFLEIQHRDGILRGQYDASLRSPDFYCLTGNAQMAIVWYRLYELTSDSRYLQGAHDTVEFLKNNQRLDGSSHVRGGLKGSAPIWGPYMYLRYPNWSTKFLVDALLLSETYPE